MDGFTIYHWNKNSFSKGSISRQDEFSRNDTLQEDNWCDSLYNRCIWNTRDDGNSETFWMIFANKRHQCNWHQHVCVGLLLWYVNHWFLQGPLVAEIITDKRGNHCYQWSFKFAAVINRLRSMILTIIDYRFQQPISAGMKHHYSLQSGSVS